MTDNWQDVVARLTANGVFNIGNAARSTSLGAWPASHIYRWDAVEAAALIEKQAAEIDRLREALTWIERNAIEIFRSRIANYARVALATKPGGDK